MCGVRDAVLNWFDSHLNDRKQKVNINDSISTIINVDTGVPQESILLNIYVNDIVIGLWIHYYL